MRKLFYYIFGTSVAQKKADWYEYCQAKRDVSKAKVEMQNARFAITRTVCEDEWKPLCCIAYNLHYDQVEDNYHNYETFCDQFKETMCNGCEFNLRKLNFTHKQAMYAQAQQNKKLFWKNKIKYVWNNKSR